jgi:hypothetical protein
MTVSAVELQTIIREHEATRPRNQQRLLGPSGVGHPCARNLAYQILGYEPINLGGDPWAAIVGTATHAWLQSAFSAANDRLGHVRWVTEQPVMAWAGHGGEGTCDLYDVDNAEVIDWKILGVTSLRDNVLTLKAEYEVQRHVYGLGLENLGLPVRTVTVALLPRSGQLAGLRLLSAPYDRSKALEAKARVDDLVSLVTAPVFETVGVTPLGSVPASPDQPRCAYCPFWRPGSTDLDQGCPGVLPGDGTTFRPLLSATHPAGGLTGPDERTPTCSASPKAEGATSPLETLSTTSSSCSK